MATRNTARATKQTNKPVDIQDAEIKRTAFFEAQEEYLDSMGIPTERRAFVAFAIGCATSCAVGITLSKITTAAMIGAAVLTGSSFITMMVWVLGLILAIYASLKSFTKAFNYVASSQIDRDAIAVKNWFEDKASFMKAVFTPKVHAS